MRSDIDEITIQDKQQNEIKTTNISYDQNSFFKTAMVKIKIASLKT